MSKKSHDKITYFTPPLLKSGDSIMIVAPAGFLLDSTSIDAGVLLAKSWGLHVVVGKNVFKRHNHFAGTDMERLSDFQTALNDKSIKAIWCARGGYGSVRIIDQIDFSEFLKQPKWLVGFSDITALHEHIHNLGVASIHATMAGGIKTATEASKESLYKSLFGKSLSYVIEADTLNKKGSAKGVLVGGNLAMIDSMIGSKSEINTDGKILFIEDIDENLYRVDRMMYTLKRNGSLKKLKGLIVGDFTYDVAKDTLFGGSHKEIILNAVKEYNYPVLFSFPAGHIKDNRALIFGKETTLVVGDTNAIVAQ
jgi:muramoyltetrapeptide carboxypeptidase